MPNVVARVLHFLVGTRLANEMPSRAYHRAPAFQARTY
jgi:hypothetical protein